MGEGAAGHAVTSRTSQGALTLTYSTHEVIICLHCTMLLVRLMHLMGLKYVPLTSKTNYLSPELHVWISEAQKVQVVPVRTWGAPQVSQGSAGHLEGQPGRRGVEVPRKTRPGLECRGRWGSLRNLADWNIPNRLRDIGNKMYTISIQAKSQYSGSKDRLQYSEESGIAYLSIQLYRIMFYQYFPTRLPVLFYLQISICFEGAAQ